MKVPVYVCPACKTRIPFGTETKPPPDYCPGCRRLLYIPSVYDPPPVELTCPKCVRKFQAEGGPPGQSRCCSHCGTQVVLPPD